MSSSGPRYHIPFPTAFLSVNTPINKSVSPINNATSPSTALPPHNFLSNRPAVPRHSSISSVSSEESVSASGAAPSPSAEKSAPTSVDSQKASAFLALNRKYAALPPTTAKEMSKSLFLSNRG